jgi:hypothetical protein
MMNEIDKKCYICGGKGYTRPHILVRLALAPFTFGGSLLLIDQCPICRSSFNYTKTKELDSQPDFDPLLKDKSN